MIAAIAFVVAGLGAALLLILVALWPDSKIPPRPA